MKPFQWRVALCDDNPEDQSIVQTVRMLEKAGLQVTVVSGPDEFIEKADTLAACHIALIDMDWGGMFASFAPPEFIPKELGCDLKEYVRAWVNALTTWGQDSSQTSEPKCQEAVERGDWPRSPIGRKEKGAWLGALISNIAPGIEIVFYSGKPDIISSGFAAALGRFRSPAYSIETKSDEAGLGIEAIQRHLKRLQDRSLRRSDIYDWYLAQVLLPSLIGTTPKETKLVEPSLDEAKPSTLVYKMVPQNFFPGITLGRVESVESLLRFYDESKSVPLRLAALTTLEHSLRPWKIQTYLSDPVKLTTILTRSSQQLLASMPSAVSTASCLWAAAETLRLNSRESEQACLINVTRAWQLMWATLYEPNCELARLAQRFDGNLQSSHVTEYPVDEATAEHRKKQMIPSPLLRIDLVGLERCCEHLTAHSAQGKLIIHDNPHQVRIAWHDRWNGNMPQPNEFRAILEESLEKPMGPYRGLPSVILFGLVNRAQAIAIQLGDNWLEILGNADDRKSIDSGYKILWIFPKT